MQILLELILETEETDVAPKRSLTRETSQENSVIITNNDGKSPGNTVLTSADTSWLLEGES